MHLGLVGEAVAIALEPADVANLEELSDKLGKDPWLVYAEIAALALAKDASKN
jgi:hypothetical protein